MQLEDRPAPADLPPSSGEDRAGREERVCMLEVCRQLEREPLGFVAWEIPLPQILCRVGAHFVSDDVGGRLLYHTDRQRLYAGAEAWQPSRTAPLLLWLTHRSLRVLYLCSPTEAYLLGQRLSYLAPRAVGATEVLECAPAVLYDLLQRFCALTEGMALFPSGDDLPDDPEDWFVPWRRRWTDEMLSARPERGRIGPPVRLPVALSERASVMLYEDDPLVLTPMRLSFVDRGISSASIMGLLREQAQLRDPLYAGPHSGLRLLAGKAELTVLAPLMEAGWDERLARFRDGLEPYLGRAVYTPVFRQDVESLIEMPIADLRGYNEVYQPRLSGVSVHRPPATEDSEELFVRLTNAVGFPLDSDWYQGREQTPPVLH